MDLIELRERQSRIISEARDRLDSIGADTPEARVAEIHRQHDEAIAEFDRLQGIIDRQQALQDGEGRSAGDPDRRPNREDRQAGGDAEPMTYALRPEQRLRDQITRQNSSAASAYRDLTEGAYLRSLVLGGKTDVERRALSEGTDSAGGYTVPEVIAAGMIDRMRAASVAIRAGARTVPLTSDTNHIAKLATDPTPGWRSENGPVTTSDPTFTRISFTPRSLTCEVIVSRELIEDSLNIETVLPEVIASAMALELDRVALFGTGSAPQPRGVVNFAGINSIAHGAALESYGPLIRARTAIRSDNSPDPTAFIMNPRDDGALAELVDTTGQPLRVPSAIEKIPFLATTSVPANEGAGTNESTIIAGYFPHLLLGMRSQLRIEVLKERYADNMQYGFLAHLRADVALEQDGSFCKITGITPAA